MRYRVEELAKKAGVGVDTVRYYQSQRLLPQPVREGRVAWYTDDHLERIDRIRELKAKGFTLRSIARFVESDADAADRALVEEVAGTIPGASGEESLSLEELAERTGVTPTLLEAVIREGLLVGAPGPDEEVRFGAGDVRVVEAGLALLETGLPLSELLALARDHDRAMRKIARQAVEMFVRFVRDPIRVRARDEDEAAERLVSAFRTMLPATTEMVGHHFRRVLLAEARARIEAEGVEQELAAIDGEAETLG